MKSVIYGIVLVMLLAGVAGATSSCEAAASKPTKQYTTCFLEKPVETVVGDEITINCTEKTKEGNRLTIEPKSRASFSIIGYNEYDEAIFSDHNSLRGDGTYSFEPRFAGEYLIQISSCDYNARFEVGEDPDAEEEVNNAITGGAVAADNSAEEPEENETEGNSTEETDTQEGGEENSPPKKESNILNIMINGTETEEDKKAVSNFAVLLVGLMIS
jgi:hypothetical protein